MNTEPAFCVFHVLQRVPDFYEEKCVWHWRRTRIPYVGLFHRHIAHGAESLRNW